MLDTVQRKLLENTSSGSNPNLLLREAASEGDIGGIRAALAEGSEAYINAIQAAIQNDQDLALEYIFQRAIEAKRQIFVKAWTEVQAGYSAGSVDSRGVGILLYPEYKPITIYHLESLNVPVFQFDVGVVGERDDVEYLDTEYGIDGESSAATVEPVTGGEGPTTNFDRNIHGVVLVPYTLRYSSHVVLGDREDILDDILPRIRLPHYL